MKLLLLLPLVLIPPALAFGLNAWIVGNASELPQLGSVADGLPPCPPGVDCVSSLAEDGAVGTLPFDGDPDQAFEDMLRFLRQDSNAEFVEFAGDYLHVVFVRQYLKLVEDVELLLDREAGVFQVRAFERTGSPASDIRARVASRAVRWDALRARGTGDEEGSSPGR